MVQHVILTAQLCQKLDKSHFDYFNMLLAFLNDLNFLIKTCVKLVIKQLLYINTFNIATFSLKKLFC